jgi:hypothetical protein
MPPASPSESTQADPPTNHHSILEELPEKHPENPEPRKDTEVGELPIAAIPPTDNNTMLLMVLTLPSVPEDAMAKHFRSHLRQSADALNTKVHSHIIEGTGDMETIANELTLHIEAFRKTGSDPEKTWFEKRFAGTNRFWSEALRGAYRIEFEIAHYFSNRSLNPEQNGRLTSLASKLPELRTRLQR